MSLDSYRVNEAFILPAIPIVVFHRSEIFPALSEPLLADTAKAFHAGESPCPRRKFAAIAVATTPHITFAFYLAAHVPVLLVVVQPEAESEITQISSPAAPLE